MTNRSDVSKEVMRAANPKNVSKAARKKAAKTFLGLEDPLLEKQYWKKEEKRMRERFRFLDKVLPGESVKRKGKRKTRLATKGGKIMIGYKAGGKV